jgi:hypothetical protein
MEDKEEEEEEREDVYAQLWIWIQAVMSKSSWGAQMPKSDKKENITQLQSNTLCKNI